MFAAALVSVIEKNAVEVWPENHAVFLLFRSLSTQWNVGMGGPVGLRYEAVYPLIDRMRLSDDEWQETFYALQEMEAAALDAMREK